MTKPSSKRLELQPVREGAVAPSISKVLGLVPTLPGESVEAFQQSLDALIAELDAKTVLQVYIAEKIHDCLWWIRRYEEQKRATIIAEMAAVAKGSFSNIVNEPQKHVRDLLMKNKVDDRLLSIAASQGHTIESLRQKATENKTGFIAKLDQQIALQTKLLSGLQASYEVAFSRKTNLQRMALQNDLLRRDLQAIDVDANEVSPDGQRKAARR